MRTVGVEEELLLVDAERGVMAPAASRVLRIATSHGAAGEDDLGRAALVHELQEQQLEIHTAPHASMSSLEAELRTLRSTAASAAREAGASVVASASAPVPVRSRLVRTPRYAELAERFGIVAREQLLCGCHVHVSVGSDEEAVGVLDRIRVWLPALLALSANSPFWQGRDSGYASFRWPALGRWPLSGPPGIFGSAARYHAFVDDLLASGVVLDQGMVYLDARCSHRFPTVEIRVADVCLDVRDAVLLAALCRGLVDTAAEEWAAGVPPPPVATTLLRLATWQAAKSGTCDRLLDPTAPRPRPACEVIGALVAHVSPALRRAGDRELVATRVERVLVRGSGAARQRAVLARTGHLVDLLAVLARATLDPDA